MQRTVLDRQECAAWCEDVVSDREHTRTQKKENGEGIAPFVRHRLHCRLLSPPQPPRHPHRRKHPSASKRRGEPGQPLLRLRRRCARRRCSRLCRRGFRPFPGAGIGVTRSPRGATVAAPAADAAGRELWASVLCDLLAMSDYQPPPPYSQFTGSPLELALARHVCGGISPYAPGVGGVDRIPQT